MNPTGAGQGHGHVVEDESRTIECIVTVNRSSIITPVASAASSIFLHFYTDAQGVRSESTDREFIPLSNRNSVQVFLKAFNYSNS